ncbi:hypothetical protein PRZ48_006032 [Zasmidium cellare]|uniref:Uncharacterized protein n=1 Tax=Zasmidium cellare TaxID=395010 RepID=A0ABR0ELZ6_ZASCE|nr:hypothetical protein PRZ48_006032 [Zasmidium cellare]
MASTRVTETKFVKGTFTCANMRGEARRPTNAPFTCPPALLDLFKADQAQRKATQQAKGEASPPRTKAHELEYITLDDRVPKDYWWAAVHGVTIPTSAVPTSTAVREDKGPIKPCQINRPNHVCMADRLRAMPRFQGKAN